MSNFHDKSLLAFGAHPDDIEFGCGGVVALETRAGRKAHLVVCSLGEAASNGTPDQRGNESREAAAILGASIEMIELDGDAHLELRVEHSIKLAEIIRRVRPTTILAPTCMENQHPDHSRLGQIVRDAARLARYGGFKELMDFETHTIEQLLYFAVTPDAVPRDIPPILIDVSQADVVSVWTAAMNAHGSQAGTRHYLDLQLNRARLLGAKAGIEYAIELYPNDPIVFDSLAAAGRGARHF